ncbi:MAG: hypothetical protein ACJ8FO_06960 [Sphingomicrobium sp.]
MVSTMVHLRTIRKLASRGGRSADDRDRAASALDAAIGLIQGTPMRSEIERRDPGLLREATDAATDALRQFEGPNGFEAPMSAHIVTATK